MAAGDINDPLSNIPNIALVDQSAASAAPGAGYGRLEVVNGVLGLRVGTGAWVPLASLVAGLLTALDEKVTPLATDFLLMQDEADASALKKVQAGAVAGLAEAGAHTVSTNQLAGDVTMTNANQYYDGPSLTVAAGTWLFIASVYIVNSASAVGGLTAKLWDGSTVIASGEATGAGIGYQVQISLVGSASPVGSTTYKVSVAGQQAGGAIAAAAITNGAGNNASTLVAVRLY